MISVKPFRSVISLHEIVDNLVDEEVNEKDDEDGL